MWPPPHPPLFKGGRSVCECVSAMDAVSLSVKQHKSLYVNIWIWYDFLGVCHGGFNKEWTFCWHSQSVLRNQNKTHGSFKTLQKPPYTRDCWSILTSLSSASHEISKMSEKQGWAICWKSYLYIFKRVKSLTNGYHKTRVINSIWLWKKLTISMPVWYHSNENRSARHQNIWTIYSLWWSKLQTEVLRLNKSVCRTSLN